MNGGDYRYVKPKYIILLHKTIIMTKAKVYFSPNITPEKVVQLYHKVWLDLPWNIAIKLHSWEKWNQNFLKPEFWKPIIDELNWTVVECNTAYEWARNSTDKHKELIHEHGRDKYFKFDLLDAEWPDMALDIPNWKVLKQNFVWKNMANYDSMIVLSHFKWHPMWWYWWALKQLSIGCASSEWKSRIHSAWFTKDQTILRSNLPEQDKFLESMADAACSVVNYFKWNMVFINVMKNLSVDCDCCAVAEDPCMKDLWILASLDPIAIDQACVDLVYDATDDPGQKHFLERLESRHWIHTIESAVDLWFGTRDYELIQID